MTAFTGRSHLRGKSSSELPSFSYSWRQELQEKMFLLDPFQGFCHRLYGLHISLCLKKGSSSGKGGRKVSVARVLVVTACCRALESTAWPVRADGLVWQFGFAGERDILLRQHLPRWVTLHLMAGERFPPDQFLLLSCLASGSVSVFLSFSNRNSRTSPSFSDTSCSKCGYLRAINTGIRLLTWCLALLLLQSLMVYCKDLKLCSNHN